MQLNIVTWVYNKFCRLVKKCIYKVVLTCVDEKMSLVTFYTTSNYLEKKTIMVFKGTAAVQ